MLRLWPQLPAVVFRTVEGMSFTLRSHLSHRYEVQLLDNRLGL